MTDKLTIELLCEMLEEHGLSCHTHYLHAFWWVGQKLYEAADNLDGTLTVGRLTPEQAIAATLGSGTCEMYRDNCGTWHCKSCEHGADTITGSDGVLESWSDSWPPNFCPNCGRKAVER